MHLAVSRAQPAAACIGFCLLVSVRFIKNTPYALFYSLQMCHGIGPSHLWPVRNKSLARSVK